MKKELDKKIRKILTDAVRNKLKNYKPETNHKPFHYRLIGKDRYAVFSFIHSMNTTFGMSIFEQLGEAIAESYGYEAERQFNLKGNINSEASNIIKEIHGELRQGNRDPDIKKEVKEIKNKIKLSKKNENHPDKRVDLFIKKNEEENYFDITTVKPNIKAFATLKEKLLNWTALRLSQDKNTSVKSRLAIPYNPYYPEPYERWTLKGLYDLEEKEILVGEDFWNFLADEDIYDDLLNVVKEVGESLKPELDNYFSQFEK